jgi:hypothetical protein
VALLAGCGGGTLKDVNLGPVAHGTAAGGTASHGKASRGAESPLAVRAIRLAARQARRVNSYEVTLNTRVTGLAAGTAAVDSTSGVLQIRLKPSLLANFTMNISVAAALAEVPPSLRGPAESVLTTMGVRTVHFSAWIDRHHQVRKLITVEAGNGTRITSRTEIVAINQPVHVQLPPASQVATGPAGPSMLG